MTNEQDNRLNRNLGVGACVERPEIAPVLGAVPEFPGLKASLDAKNGRLLLLKARQFADLRTLNAARDLWRLRVTPITLQLSAALVALGTKEEDPSILDEASFSPSLLKRFNDPNFVQKTQKILSLCSEHKAALTIYHVTSDMIESYETMVGDLGNAVKAVVDARAEKKQITREINTTLKETDTIIARIAIIVETLKEAYPVFYEIFRNACHVVNAPGSTLSANGLVVDADSGEGIAKCRLKITGYTPLVDPPEAVKENEVLKKSTTQSLTELTKSVKYTSRNAAFRYKNLPAGTYEIAAYLAGYNEVKSTFYVNTGITAELFIKLPKLATAAA
jgi:hypothetical protein